MRRTRWLLAVPLLLVAMWVASRALHSRGRGVLPASSASSGTATSIAPPLPTFVALATQKLEGWVGDAQKHGLPLAQVCATKFGNGLADDETTPRCVLTREDGRYSFAALPIGRYDVVASARGYLPRRYGEDTDHAFVDLVAQADPGPIDVILVAGGVAIAGTVLDPLGRPVMGARITASVLADNEVTAADAVTWSDASGNFSLWSAPGPMWISTTAKDYVLDEQRVEAPVSSMTIALRWGGVIVGSVLDAASGSPVPYALVSARQDMSTSLTVRAGEDGTYRIEGLEPGGYRIEASAPGRFGSSTNALRVDGGETASAPALMLHGVATVSGSVRLPNGAPCTDGRVTLRPDGMSDKYLSVDLQTTGVAYFPTVHAGSYTLDVDCEGFDTSSIGSTITVGATGSATFDVTVAEGLAIRGVVVDESGKLFARAQVSAHLAPSPGDRRSIYRSARTKSDGTFVLLGVPNGAYDLEASAEGAAPATANAKVQGTSVSVRIALEKGSTVSGRVVDDDGKAVSGAEVSIDASRGYAHAKTDADGRFLARGLAPGKAYVSIRRLDGGSLRLISTSDGAIEDENARVDLALGNTKIDLRIERLGHWMRGKVVDPSGAIVSGANVEIGRVDEEGNDSKGRFSPFASTTTDKDGRFSFERLPKGPFRFHASSTSGSASSPSVATEVDAQVTLERHAEISGIVTFASGIAPAHFVVRLETEDGVTYPRSESYFKNGGAFSFSDLPPGTYTLRATSEEGSAKGKATVAAGERRTVSLVMETFGEIRGTVTLADGSAGANVHVRADETDLENGESSHGSVMTDATGTFHLRSFLPGKYSVHAYRHGPHPANFDVVTVEVTSGVTTTIAVVATASGAELPQD